MENNFLNGIHTCENSTDCGDWRVRFDCNHGLFLEDIKHLLTPNRLQTLEHNYIAKHPISSEERKQECDISFPGIVAKTVRNPMGLPFRLLDGAHRIDKMNDRNITKSKFYVLSESEFMKYLTIGAYYKENHIEVVENFIPTKNLNNLQMWMINPEFNWNYNPSNLDYSLDDFKKNNMYGDKFVFNHTWIWEGILKDKSIINDFQILMQSIQEKTGTNLIKRIKANLYTNQGKQIKYDKHTDMPDSKDFYWSLVYHVNDCNGMTVLDDEEKNIYREIPQKSNQLVMFDGRINHYGVTQTDNAIRLVINFLLI